MSPELKQSQSVAPVVRSYAEEDIPSLRACVIDLQESERRIDPRLRTGESIADEYLEYLFRECKACMGTMLVLEAAGAVAGFVAVLAHVPYERLDEPPGDYGLVSDLVVRQPFRRRGFGALLLREAERWAGAAGATELRIGVLAENDNAERLYRRAGFIPYSAIMSKRLR